MDVAISLVPFLGSFSWRGPFKPVPIAGDQFGNSED